MKLKDAGALTSRLEELSHDLHTELTEGDADFSRLVELAGEVRDFADALTDTFTRIDEALSRVGASDGRG